MKELIIEARKNVSKIAKATKTRIGVDTDVVFAKADNGDYIISELRQGWNTRKPTINFGCKPLTKQKVSRIIDEYERHYNAMNVISKEIDKYF